jgi:small subunit ribosomal protein S18
MPRAKPKSRSDGPRDRDRDGKGGKGFRGKPRVRVCHFCKEKVGYVDYKDAALLRRFTSDRGKIKARRVSGLCQRHQRDVAIAVRNAREMAIIPYAAR